MSGQALALTPVSMVSTNYHKSTVTSCKTKDDQGDDASKQEFEQKARIFDTSDYWRTHQWNLQVTAVKEVANNPVEWQIESQKRKRKLEPRKDNSLEETRKQKRSKIEHAVAPDQGLAVQLNAYNPYEGDPTALQLAESVDDFLARLKPSSIDTPQPWIWCANFHSSYRPAGENVAVFKQLGTNLLEKFMAKRYHLGASFDPPKPAGTITRMMSADRETLEGDILNVAQQNGVIGGKWLLFPAPNKVDAYWSAVVRGTVDGRLGISAKVATNCKPVNPNNPGQVVCVYTRDFNNEEDLKRVLKELVRLGLAEEHVGPPGGWKHVFDVKAQIYYKPNAYTYLDLMSQNKYKIRPSLWATSWLLTEQDVQGDKAEACKEMWQIEQRARAKRK